MEGGGRLTRRAGWSESRDPLPPRRRPPDRRMKVEVEDTGPGIPPSEGDRIFTPFYTTKEGGTGIGLALAHKIVEEHGGTIAFRSGRAGGTVFTVVLPLIAEPLAGSGSVGEAVR